MAFALKKVSYASRGEIDLILERSVFAFGALMLLTGSQEQRPACKHTE